jgi:hypothetical protein
VVLGHARSVVGEYQSGERGRPARLVSREQPSRRPRRLLRNIYRGGYWSRGPKRDEVGDGSQGRRTAEGTILEIRCLTRRMVLMAMVRRSASIRRAELHQERAAARGHESHGDIRAKQKRGQQYDGQHIGTLSLTEPSLHDVGASPCQSRRCCSSRHPDSAASHIGRGGANPTTFS